VAISFTRAVEVAKDQTITSTQLATLARAFNDRLRSGLADGPWRIFFYWLSVFRQVRNPDETGYAFPSQGEFFELYQHISAQDAEWPLTGPGDPEGANVANQMNAFVFGNSALQLLEETERFATLAWPQIEPNPREAWEYAKQQRGGYDPRSGGIASPALYVARSHGDIRYGMRSPHGLSYGGWFPLPELGSPCEDPNPGDDEDPLPNFRFKVTSLVDGSSVVYDGSCQPAVFDEYPTHVAYVARMPWAYYVFLNNGTLDVYPTTQWVEGPYEGEGVLQKAENGALGRILHNFIREFRGTQSQRETETRHLSHAFDFQKFFTQQYHLAPQIGVETTDGFIDPIYPKAKSEGTPTAGGFLIWDSTRSTTNGWRSGFVLASALITAKNLNGPLTLSLLDEEVVRYTVTIEPDSSANASVLWIAPTPWTPVVIEWRIDSVSLGITSTCEIEIEHTELMSYKPQIEDAYTVLRASAALETTPDGVGANETTAEQLSDDYFNFGCIINRAGLPGLQGRFSSVNPNAVFDAARRWSKMARLVRRQEFVGIALENGVTVLWFKRYAFGLHNQIPADIFEGIGPNRERLTNGDIRPGYVYENRSEEAVNYNGVLIHQGDRFTGVSGVISWEGGGEIYEAQGIRHTAPPKGYSNEWLIGFELKPYHPSESSLWKPSGYSDYFPLVNRCLFYSPEVATDSALKRHTSFGESVGTSGTVAPEAPSGFNYSDMETSWFGSHNVNTYGCDPMDTACIELRQNFYKSCRVYEPDIEIDKAEVEIDSGGNELIKLTLKSRIHHCDAAPSSFSNDPSTWDRSALAAEPYRSHENALREYIVNQTYGTSCNNTAPGNNAINSTVQLLTDNPFGSCYPHFRLTQLVPMPYDDGNDKQNSVDTRFEHDPFPQMELYLKAMCEGYVDGVSSAQQACTYGTISAFDYTFTNLCVQAFGNRYFTTLRRQDQPDNPQGYGPCPNTEAYAEVFNQYVKAINLLTTVRVMIPASLYCNLGTGETIYSKPMTTAGGGSASCSGGAVAAFAHDTPPTPGIDSYSGWSACSGGLGSITAGAAPTGDCIGSEFEVRAYNSSISFKWEVTDPDALAYALPSEWSDMLSSSAAVMASVRTSTSRLNYSVVTDPAAATQCCDPVDEPCPAFIAGGGNYLAFDGPTVWSDYSCQFYVGGFGCPDIPPSYLYWVRTVAPTDCPSGPSSSTEYTILTATVPMIAVPLV